jgi:hypothetical protein
MSNVKVKPAVELMSRLLVLHSVTSDLARGFGVDDSGLEVIKKGIIDQQLLESIYICYRDKQNNLRGTIILKIDWKSHEVLAKTEQGSMYRIDPSKSIQDQISAVYQTIVNYTKNLRTSWGIEEVQRVYILREEIRNNKQEFNAAIEFLNLYIMTDEEWREIKDKKYKTHVKFRCATLSELSLIIDHDKF